MPIPPHKARLYPRDWPWISRAVKTRAGWRCEWCGARHGEPHPVTGTIVRLAAAHVTHDRSCDDMRLIRSWCQRCHLRYDAAEHRRAAARTRREAMRTLELPV